MPELVDAALWYANRLGWAIVPLHTPDSKGRCSCGVRECKSIGKHPRTLHGVHDASKNKSQIIEWWNQWPDANVGLAAGESSNVIVIDVDPRNGGNKSIRELGRPPGDVVAKTGGGGRHYFVAYTDSPINSKPAPGIDIQTTGHIVVLAPSLHYLGRRYKWLTEKPKRSLPDAPDWAVKSNPYEVDPDKPSPLGTILREGRRNTGLTSVAGTWRRAGMEEGELTAALKVYNRKWCEPPLSEREVETIARSVCRYAPENLDASILLSLTDKGCAERLVQLHGDDLRFSGSLKWLSWNGRYWQSDRSTGARYLALSVAEMLRSEAESLDEKTAKAYQRRADECESARGVEGLLKVAESLPELSAELRSWDANPWLFNVQNGTLDLQNGVEFREHRREDRITKIAPVTYDPDARAPRFERFIKETFKTKELIRFMQRLLGYALTGDCREQIFPVFWGTGANGKSTLLEHVTRSVFGQDYQVQLTAEALLEKRFASHPTEIMDMRGARLVVASESGRKRPLDEEMVKSLTGGDMIKGRRLYSNPEEFKATAKLILVTNNKPRASNSDAIWRRMRLVPFTNKLAEEDQDKTLGEVLEAEASGILNWMIKGCIAWQKSGLKTPEVVMTTTTRLRVDQDVLGYYLAESVVFDERKSCRMSDIYGSYKLWCADAGVSALGKINFGRELLERYPNVKRRVSNGQTRLYGLKPLLGVTI